jgi:hypothetical protein
VAAGLVVESDGPADGNTAASICRLLNCGHQQARNYLRREQRPQWSNKLSYFAKALLIAPAIE